MLCVRADHRPRRPAPFLMYTYSDLSLSFQAHHRRWSLDYRKNGGISSNPQEGILSGHALRAMELGLIYGCRGAVAWVEMGRVRGARVGGTRSGGLGLSPLPRSPGGVGVGGKGLKGLLR